MIKSHQLRTKLLTIRCFIAQQIPSPKRKARLSTLHLTPKTPLFFASHQSMETDESQRVVPFQLQFDKPIASQVSLSPSQVEKVYCMLVFGVIGAILLLQIKIAEWNPEKDLLAMVTEDSKLLLHRFNWQRLWTTSPGQQHFHYYIFRN